MKYIALGFLLLTTTAQAQPLGCFVDISGLPGCSTSTVQCSSTSADNQSFYGPTVGELCDRLIQSEKTEVQCTSGYMKIAAEYDLLLAEREAVWTRSERRASLVRRLRRKCGRACVGIR